MARVRHSRFVRPDMQRIWRWIARDNPRAADRVLRRIGSRFQFIAEFPESGAPRDEYGSGVRMAVVDSYLILYRIDVLGPRILRVVHGAMDLSRIDIP
jgi:toxin ParE1/3/4